MKTKDYLFNARIFAGRRPFVIAVATLLFVLLFVSCAGSRRVTRERDIQRDSVTERLVTTVKPLKVPSSQVSLRLNPLDLSRMPDGSKYTARDGQAALEVFQTGDSIYITSTCDSLQIFIENQYREITRLKEVVNEKKEREERPPSLKEKFSYVAIGVVLTILLSIIWQLKRKL